MKMMFRYELKKVFARAGGKVALFLLLLLIGITCYFATNVTYVNEQGKTEAGPFAVSRLKAMQKEWAGYLNEETIQRVISENKKIRTSPEAMSEDVPLKDIAYSRGQGIQEIRNLLNCSYAAHFREYDYYRADSLSENDAPAFYSNRVSLLAQWLEEEADGLFSEEEKEYLIGQYSRLQTPFYYDYMKGWTQLFEYAPTIIMITMLILGYLISGIFSNEFSWKSDAIFFTSAYGRNRAIRTKLKSAFFIVTVIYWAAVLLYTLSILLYLGADGWECPVQADFSGWKCFYNITVWQKYILIVAGGYIGCLFISSLGMLVSAKTKSAVLAVMVPFVLIFIPSFLSNMNSSAVSKILGLLPDQLLQAGTALNYFTLYTLGGKVWGAIPILLVIYPLLTLLIAPVTYREYRHKEIS